MSKWHGGKGGLYRESSIPKRELQIREELWRAKEEDKPALLEMLNKLVADRAKHINPR